MEQHTYFNDAQIEAMKKTMKDEIAAVEGHIGMRMKTAIAHFNCQFVSMGPLVETTENIIRQLPLMSLERMKGSFKMRWTRDKGLIQKDSPKDACETT